MTTMLQLHNHNNHYNINIQQHQRCSLWFFRLAAFHFHHRNFRSPNGRFNPKYQLDRCPQALDLDVAVLLLQFLDRSTSTSPSTRCRLKLQRGRIDLVLVT